MVSTTAIFVTDPESQLTSASSISVIGLFEQIPHHVRVGCWVPELSLSLLVLANWFSLWWVTAAISADNASFSDMFAASKNLFKSAIVGLLHGGAAADGMHSKKTDEIQIL